MVSVSVALVAIRGTCMDATVSHRPAFSWACLYTPRVVPASFQNLRALRVINIAAVGFALASVVVASVGPELDRLNGHPSPMIAPYGFPTLVCGMLWAWLVRRPATVGNTRLRRGWVASVPLAALNAGLTAALDFRRFDPGTFLMEFVFTAVLGVIVWGPALVATLLCFGLPIARAQKLAKQGLAGEERGERIVGLTCAAISAIGLALASTPAPSWSHGGSTLWTARALGILGFLAGATSTILASARASRRRAFVADAEAGKVPGYRVEATDDGKVLVRIVAQGKGYRVADFEEEVFELDAAGEATRPRQAEG
jgi:hypothetical protein